VRRPGTLPGDQSVYAGNRLLGHVRGSVSGVTAYRPDGSVLGTFTGRKEAIGAIHAFNANNRSGSEPAT
jgi:hypothetical protein